MPTWTPISTQTIGAGVSSVVFNSFSGYTDLVFITSAAPASAGNGLIMSFNGATGNYSNIQLYGQNPAGIATNVATVLSNGFKALNNLESSANNFSAGWIWIPNYSSTSTYKQILSRSGGTTGTMWSVGAWNTTNAITSITFVDEAAGNIRSGSTFTLFGLLAA